MMKTAIFTLFLLAFLIGDALAQRSVKMGSIPIIHELPLHAAIAQGFLEQEGIKAELQVVAGGAVGIPAMLGGSLHLTHSDYTTVVKAWDAGFGIVVVFPIAKHTVGNDSSALVVRADAPIKTAQDLEGKTVAPNVLHGVSWLYTLEWMTLKGADPKKVNWVEIPFPAMMGALRAGRVDAVYSSEPFIALEMEKGGLRVLERPFTMVQPVKEMVSFLATEKWASDNRDLVEGLARALKKGTDYINANPGEWPRLFARYTRLEPAWIPKIVKPVWRYPINPEVLQVESDLNYKWGLIKKKQSVKEFIWPTALR